MLERIVSSTFSEMDFSNVYKGDCCLSLQFTVGSAFWSIEGEHDEAKTSVCSIFRLENLNRPLKRGHHKADERCNNFLIKKRRTDHRSRHFLWLISGVHFVLAKVEIIVKRFLIVIKRCLFMNSSFKLDFGHS